MVDSRTYKKKHARTYVETMEREITRRGRTCRAKTQGTFEDSANTVVFEDSASTVLSGVLELRSFINVLAHRSSVCLLTICCMRGQAALTLVSKKEHGLQTTRRILTMARPRRLHELVVHVVLGIGNDTFGLDAINSTWDQL